MSQSNMETDNSTGNGWEVSKEQSQQMKQHGGQSSLEYHQAASSEQLQRQT